MFILDDVGMTVLSMDFVDNAYIVQLALACRNNALQQDPGYAKEVDNSVDVAVEAGCVLVESRSAGVSSFESIVMTTSLHLLSYPIQ